MPDSAPAPTVFPPLPDAPIHALRWDAIERSPLNPRKRFDEAEIEALAGAIAADGLLQNLVVRPHPKLKDKFELLAGERRHRAIGKLIETGRADPARLWPCRVTPCEDREAMMLALAENVARKDLTPLEEAEAFQRMLGLKLSKEEIAKAAGCTPRQVELRVKLLTALSPKALAALKDGKISLEHARELTKAPPKRQDSILGRIVPPGTKVDDPDHGYGHGAIVTAEELKAELRRDSVPAGEAVFDPALYKGARFIDPDDGVVYFEDIDEFEKLQAAAIEAKRKELAAKNGNRVEVLEGWHARSLAQGKLDWPWEKMRKGQEGEAYVLLAVDAGRFIVKEGVVKVGGYGNESSNARKASNQRADTSAEAPSAKPDEIPVGAARHALTIRTHAIQSAIAADGANGATHAKRLVVFAWLAGDDPLRFSRQGRWAITRAPAIKKTLADFAKLGLRDDADDTEKMWGRIVALTPAKLDALFAALVAAQFSVESPAATQCWPEDDELAIAATLKADPRDTFQLDAEFLAKLKKGQLLRIAADLKLEADPRFAKGSDHLTASVLRKIILDPGPAGLMGYVPIWCRFEPEAAMKAQLKATPKIGAQAAKATIAKIAATPAKPPKAAKAGKPTPKKPAAKKKAK
jgi:ParB/RepB/Spo0J family partition protein